jgi:hypothetical protein
MLSSSDSDSEDDIPLAELRRMEGKEPPLYEDREDGILASLLSGKWTFETLKRIVLVLRKYDFSEQKSRELVNIASTFKPMLEHMVSVYHVSGDKNIKHWTDKGNALLFDIEVDLEVRRDVIKTNLENIKKKEKQEKQREKRKKKKKAGQKRVRDLGAVVVIQKVARGRFARRRYICIHYKIAIMKTHLERLHNPYVYTISDKIARLIDRFRIESPDYEIVHAALTKPERFAASKIQRAAREMLARARIVCACAARNRIVSAARGMLARKRANSRRKNAELERASTASSVVDARLASVAEQRSSEAAQSSQNAKVDAWECPVCLEHSDERVATGCGHIFCSECANTLADKCYVCNGVVSLKIRLYG